MITKSLQLICFAFILIAFPGSELRAQDNDRDIPQAKIKLAERYYALNPTWRMLSNEVRQMAKALPEKRRLIFVTAIEKSIDKELLKQESVPIIAELFTKDELQALIKYYEDPLIQSALAKQETFSRKIAPVVQKMMDEAVLKFRTSPEFDNQR